MSLKTIRTLVVPIVGIGKTNPDEINYIDSKINEAAAETYRITDLEGSLLEQIFFIDKDSQLVSLPSYVDQIRGIRYYESQHKITLNDMRPRYHTIGWGRANINYRDKGLQPLKKDISNSSILVFTIPEEETIISFTVTIIGSTPVAERVAEIVTFSPGDLTKSTIFNFTSIQAIRKNTLTSTNLTVSDIDGNELAVIPNNEYVSQYRIIQVSNNTIGLTFGMVNNHIEVLFKKRFTLMRNDDDEFQCPNCDELIKWKFLEHYFAEQKGKDAIQSAIASNAKFMQILRDKVNNDDRGKTLVMDFGRNRFHDLINAGYPAYYSFNYD